MRIGIENITNTEWRQLQYIHDRTKELCPFQLIFTPFRTFRTFRHWAYSNSFYCKLSYTGVNLTCFQRKETEGHKYTKQLLCIAPALCLYLYRGSPHQLPKKYYMQGREPPKYWLHKNRKVLHKNLNMGKVISICELS